MTGDSTRAPRVSMPFLRAARCAALVAACAAAACTTAPTPKPGLTHAHHRLDAALHRATAALPSDVPVALAVRPDLLDTADRTLMPVVRKLIPQLPDDLTLIQTLLAVAFPGLPDTPELEGLDPSRPVALGLLHVPDGDRYRAAVYGSIVDVLEAPPYIHNRALLPAANPKQLTDSVARWLTLLRLPEREAPSSLTMVRADVRLFQQPGLSALVIPEQDRVRVEVAIYPTEAADPLATIADRLLDLPKADPWALNTPGRRDFVSAPGFASAYLNFAEFPTLFIAQTAFEVSEALRQMPPGMRSQLVAYNGLATQTAADLMNPLDRSFHDMALTLRADGDLTAHLTQTLTPRAARAYAKADAAVTAPPSARPDKARLARLSVGRSWRVLLAQVDRAEWSQERASAHLQRHLNASGSTPLFYATLASPLDTLGHMVRYIQLNEPNAPASLPDAFTIALDDLGLSPDGLRPRAAIAADLPPKLDPEPLRDVIDMAAAYLGSTGLALTPSVQLTDRSDGAKGKRFALGLTDAPDAFFDPSQDRSAPRGFDLRVNLPQLGQQLQKDAPPLADLLASLGTLTIRDAASGNALATTAHLSLATQSAAPTPKALPTQADASSSDDDPHDYACTATFAAMQIDLLDALVNARVNTRAAILAQSDDDLEGALNCYAKHPSTKPHAQQILSGWLLFTSRLLEGYGERNAAIPRAERACTMGRDAACAWRDQLVKPPAPK